MHKLVVLFMLIVSTTLSTPSKSFADEPEKVEKVVVTGIGTTADKARHNAIRNAVEQVVGTYVSSDTLIKDSQLIKDEILSYSGGYVKESRIISTDKADDLVNVKLEALVVATKLKRKIQALNIATKKVEGNNLFGEAFGKLAASKDASQLLLKFMSKYPQAAYNIEVGKPEIVSTNQQTTTATVQLPISISWDSIFLEELKGISAKTATKSAKKVDADMMKSMHIDKSNSENVLAIALSSSKYLTSDLINEIYLIEVGNNIENGSIKYLLSDDYGSKPIIINIDLIDNSGNIVNNSRLSLSPDSFSNSGSISYLGKLTYIYERLKYPFSYFYNYYERTTRIPAQKVAHSGRGILLETDAKLNLAIKFDVNIDELQKVSTIKAYMSSFDSEQL